VEKEKERSGGKRRGPKNSTNFALPYLPAKYPYATALLTLLLLLLLLLPACLPAASYGNRWVRTAQEMATG
jgi:hypothetical protein